MEQALWYDWRDGDRPLAQADRIYFGHETCERLLPSRRDAQAFTARLAQSPGTRLTLVTPFLTDKGLRRALALIDCLLARLGELEVVCSDWGLLHQLSREQRVTLVLGRLLTAQVTDPRIPRLLEQPHSERTLREIRHVDGTRCDLKPAHVSDSLRHHYRSCWVDKPEAIALLARYGIGRCELSNAAQGIALAFAGMRYTLHLPDVLVAVTRNCPGRGEDFKRPPAACPCIGDPAAWGAITWSHATLPVALFRRDNALYYHWFAMPADLHRLPVDRIVSASDDCGTAGAL